MRSPSPILCQRVIEVQPDFDPRDPALDLFDVTWRDLDRRAFAGRTHRGVTLRLALGAGQKLAHGAVLWRNGQRLLIANLLPCDVLVIDSLSSREHARLAYAIGNLHLPAEIHADAILLPADDATEAAVGRLSVSYRIETRRIHPITDWLPRVTVAKSIAD